MTTCRESTDLSSQRLDRGLTPLQWVKWLAHGLACSFCRRFGQQVALLRRFCTSYGETAHERPDLIPGLSPEARDRIKDSLLGDRPE